MSAIHRPPASIRFALIKHTLAVSVEPFKFSPAEPVAYELSYFSMQLAISSGLFVTAAAGSRSGFVFFGLNHISMATRTAAVKGFS
jgi:hypothetical protein